MKRLIQSLLQKGRLRCGVLILAFVIPLQSTAQRRSAIPKEAKKPKLGTLFIAPAALIGGGIFTLTDNGIFTRESVKTWRDENFSDFSSNADDYIQYAPAIVALGLKALGVKNEHDWMHTLGLLLKSEIMMGFFVVGLKHTLQVPRPDSGATTSFPSGHTAQAFTAATFLHKEFGKGRPWLSVLAYTSASAVGAMRILRNRHWVSDVLVGAGLGILVTNVVYLLDKKDQDKKNKMTISVGRLPSGETTVGLVIPIRDRMPKYLISNRTP